MFTNKSDLTRHSPGPQNQWKMMRGFVMGDLQENPETLSYHVTMSSFSQEAEDINSLSIVLASYTKICMPFSQKRDYISRKKKL